MRARTYTVIPMTSKVGLLEWVSHTTPLKSVIQDEMKQCPIFMDRNKSASDEEGTIDFAFLPSLAELRKVGCCGGDSTAYHPMFKTKSQRAVVDAFHAAVAGIPDDFIRRRLLRLAPGPEDFLTLRAEFAQTFAVSSLFGYILGLGDRHLDNLLLDEGTGGIVQIDFGAAFGLATSLLGVPELLPCRMTRQLCGALKPLDGLGLVRHFMVKAMSALRTDEAYQVGVGGVGGCSTRACCMLLFVSDVSVDRDTVCNCVTFATL